MSENRKVMLEILIYGVTSDKSRISELLAKIQRQIDKRKADKSIVRALWYIDNGEKTDYEKQDWHRCREYALKALAITVNPMDYTCTAEAWGYQPHDLASIAMWNMRMYKESLEHAKLALDKNPNDERLKNNFKLIQDFVSKNLIDDTNQPITNSNDSK